MASGVDFNDHLGKFTYLGGGIEKKYCKFKNHNGKSHICKKTCISEFVAALFLTAIQQQKKPPNVHPLRIEKQIMLYSWHGIILSNKNE